MRLRATIHQHAWRKPCTVCRTSTHGDSGSESDGDEVNRWNLRKCSAAGLDILSTVFGDELLPLIIPIVEQRLQVAARLRLVA